MFAILKQKAVGNAGLADGYASRYEPESAIIAAIGARPVFDTHTSFKDTTVTETLETTDVESLQVKFHERQDQLAEHPRLWMIIAGLAFTGLGEFCGGLLLVRDMGLSGIEQLIVALMLACIIIFLTSRAAQLSAQKKPGGRPRRP